MLGTKPSPPETDSTCDCADVLASAPEESQRALRGLTLFLRQTREFRLAIAVYNDPVAREEIIRSLAEELCKDSIQIRVLDLRQPSAQRSLLARVGEIVADDGGSRPVVMVVNLEGWVEYNPELPLPHGPDTAFLETANLQRELFPATCPVPLVFWMTELLEQAFVKQAPDLWQWRSHVFDLRTHVRPDQSLVAPDGRALRSNDYRLHPDIRLDRLGEELAAYREAGSRVDEMRILNSIGLARFQGGDAKLARNDFEESLRIARELGDRNWEGKVLANLGIAHDDLGDVRKAIEYHERALVISRELGDRRGECSVIGNLGLAHAELGDTRKAIECFEQALAISRKIGDRRGEGNALGNLGIACRASGDVRRAIEFYEQALVIDREIGDRRGEGISLGSLGSAYADLGDARKAIEYFEQALAITREVGNRRGEGIVLWNSALSCDALGNRAEAIARATAAAAIYEAIGHPSAAKVRAKLAAWRSGPQPACRAGE